MNKIALCVLGLVLAACLFLISQWQLEIIFIVMSYDIFSFNFAGFGNFGLPNFIWRDIFYVWQWISFGIACFCCLFLGEEYI